MADQFVASDPIIVHEQYENSNSILKKDIALLRLKPGREYNYYFKEKYVARLPNPGEHFSLGRFVGLGKPYATDIDFSKTLRGTNLREYAHNRCREAWGSRRIDDTVFCVYRNMSDQYTPLCYGDSGGGLVQKINGDNWTIFGILSFTSGDCLDWGPSVFTKISAFDSWIKQKMKEYGG